MFICYDSFVYIVVNLLSSKPLSERLRYPYCVQYVFIMNTLCRDDPYIYFNLYFDLVLIIFDLLFGFIKYLSYIYIYLYIIILIFKQMLSINLLHK